MRTVRMLIVFGAGIVGVGLYFVSNSALPFATFGNCFGGVICNKMLQSLELNLFVGISVILIGLAVAILSYLELRRDVDPPNIRGPFSCELEKHNDRVPTGTRAGVFISRVNLYYCCPKRDAGVATVMNGLTEYQKSLIADARTGFWDWECPRCRRKTRGLVAVQSDFRCEDHANAKLVLRDHLALMDQEHINRILFGGSHLLNA